MAVPDDNKDRLIHDAQVWSAEAIGNSVGAYLDFLETALAGNYDAEKLVRESTQNYAAYMRDMARMFELAMRGVAIATTLGADNAAGDGGDRVEPEATKPE